TGRTISGETSSERDDSGKANCTGETSRWSNRDRRASSRTRVKVSGRSGRNRKVPTESERGGGRVRGCTRRTRTTNVHDKRACSRRSTREARSSRSIRGKRHCRYGERVTGQTSRKRSIRESNRTDKVESTG